MSRVLEKKQSATKLTDARISLLAGKPAPREMLVDLATLEKEYFDRKPDLEDANQFVVFGTSGHRGTSLNGTFTEAHVLAITQAICDYRKAQGITGPLYMGKDTHALSSPAQCSSLEVRTRRVPWVDGIVITPSHNPPEDGGFKYNPPNGGYGGHALGTGSGKQSLASR
jgi:phosphoglucomutase